MLITNTNLKPDWLQKMTTIPKPEFTRTVTPVIDNDANELIEDGLALHAEIEKTRNHPAETFTRLDDFFAEFDA